MAQASVIEQRLARVERDITDLKLEFARLASKRNGKEPIAGTRNGDAEFNETAPLTDIGTLIAKTPGICGGRPRLAGTGVSIRRIVGWYKLGWSPEEIADRIGHISLAQVHAALAYYHGNRHAMEAGMAAEQAEADRLEREHREGLRQEVRLGFNQLDAGLAVPADVVYARAEERIRETESSTEAAISAVAED